MHFWGSVEWPFAYHPKGGLCSLKEDTWPPQQKAKYIYYIWFGEIPLTEYKCWCVDFACFVFSKLLGILSICSPIKKQSGMGLGVVGCRGEAKRKLIISILATEMNASIVRVVYTHAYWKTAVIVERIGRFKLHLVYWDWGTWLQQWLYPPFYISSSQQMVRVDGSCSSSSSYEGESLYHIQLPLNSIGLNFRILERHA